MLSLFFILMVHSIFLILPDTNVGVTGSDLTIAPIFLFGIGHALFTVLNTPMT